MRQHAERLMLTVLELEDPQLENTDPDAFTHAQISSVGQQAEVELHIHIGAGLFLRIIVCLTSY